MDSDTLYELTPAEFEAMCAELLRACGVAISLTHTRARDHRFTFAGTSEGKFISAQAKHLRKISPRALAEEIGSILATALRADEFLYITSAPLSAEHREQVQQLKTQIPVTLIGQAELLSALDDQTDVTNVQVSAAKQRKKLQTRTLVGGVAALLASITAAVLVNLLASWLTPSERQPLATRIANVERAMNHLKDLEKQLTNIKDEMVDTEIAKEALEADYAKAKELKKLTDEQFDAVKTALRSKSWQRTILDYVIGFVLGVGASLTGSVIYVRIRQQRALRGD